MLSNLFSRNGDSAFKDYKEKSESLVFAANCLAIGLRNPVIQRFPELSNSTEIKNWDLYCTVLQIWSGLFTIENELKNDGQFQSIKHEVFNTLRDYFPNGPKVYYIFESVVDKHKELTKIEKLEINLIEVLLGQWFIWVLTNNKPDEDKFEMTITLGRMLHRDFIQSWNK